VKVSLDQFPGLPACTDPGEHVGKIHELSTDQIRQIYAFPDCVMPLDSPPLSPKHIRPTPPFRTRPTAEEVCGIAQPRYCPCRAHGRLTKHGVVALLLHRWSCLRATPAAAALAPLPTLARQW
jgi:hypothetical protein